MSVSGENLNRAPLATKPSKWISLAKGLLKPDTSQSRPLSRRLETPKPRNSSDKDKPLPLHRVTLYRRLGWYSALVLVAGSLVLVATVGFLVFLWWSNRANSLWRWIVLEDKSSTATAIAAVFIQLTVSAQAAVAVSMLASLILEECGALLDQSLPLSLARYSNTGPVSSLIMFSRNMRRWKGMGAFVLATGLAITTGASQFSSTLLVSDVLAGTIEAYPTVRNFSTRPTDQPYALGTTDYSTVVPTSFQAFAEVWDPVETPEDQVDTGQVYRALLPLTDTESRQNILAYSGTGTVYDARVACVRPKLFNFTVYYDYAGYTHVGGKVAPNSHVPGSSWPTDGGSSDSWVDVFCRTEGEGGYGYSYSFCPLPESVYMNTNIRRGREGQGHAWLLFSWSGTLDSVYGTSNPETIEAAGWAPYSLPYLPAYSSPSTSDWKSSEAGPWLSISPTRMQHQSPTINATICYDSFVRSANIDIVATSSSNRTEPSSRYMKPENMTAFLPSSTESGATSYDLDDVKKQAGATPSRYSIEDRGILSLDPKHLRQSLSGWQEEVKRKDTIKNTSVPNLISAPIDLSNSSGSNSLDGQNMQVYWATPTSGTGVVGESFKALNYKHAALFLSVVENTGDPSLAIQALELSLARMSYYYALPDFDYRETAMTQSVVLRSYPRSNRGISVVLSTIAVHLVLVFAITIVFCLRTSYSLLDQAWPAVAQVSTQITEDVLRVSTLSKDTDVEKMIGNSEDTSAAYIHLQEEQGSGRVGIAC